MSVGSGWNTRLRCSHRSGTADESGVENCPHPVADNLRRMQLEESGLKGFPGLVRCNPVLGGDPRLELRTSSRGRRSLMSEVARKAFDTWFLERPHRCC